jgi:hypothetical protein
LKSQLNAPLVTLLPEQVLYFVTLASAGRCDYLHVEMTH